MILIYFFIVSRCLSTISFFSWSVALNIGFFYTFWFSALITSKYKQSNYEIRVNRFVLSNANLIIKTIVLQVSWKIAAKHQLFFIVSSVYFFWKMAEKWFSGCERLLKWTFFIASSFLASIYCVQIWSSSLVLKINLFCYMWNCRRRLFLFFPNASDFFQTSSTCFVL